MSDIECSKTYNYMGLLTEPHLKAYPKLFHWLSVNTTRYQISGSHMCQVTEHELCSSSCYLKRAENNLIYTVWLCHPLLNNVYSRVLIW